MVKRVYFYFFMYPSRPWLSLPRYPYLRVLSMLNNPFLPRGLKEIPPRTRPMSGAYMSPSPCNVPVPSIPSGSSLNEL